MSHKTPKLAVFVNGKSSSGKSCFCHLIEKLDYQVIHSGQVFKEFCKDIRLPSENRSELNQSGVAVSGSKEKMNEFAMLLRKKVTHSFVVYDGVRLAESLSILKNIFPHTFSIYLDTEITIRRERHIERGLEIHFDLQDKNEKIMGDQSIRESSDIILQNTSIMPFISFIESITTR